MIVVIGHFAESITSRSDMCKSIFIWIYSFHMPLFLFISGMFYKKREVLPKVLGLLMIGFVLKIGLFVETLAFHGDGNLSYTKTSGIPWYMFVLAGYMSLSYFLRNMDKRFILAFSMLLGLFSGYDASIKDAFAASRFIVFYPFFVMGEMLDPENILLVTRKRKCRLLSVFVLLIWTALCLFRMSNVYTLRPLFTGRNPFGSRFGVWGGAYRALCYMITLFTGFAVMCLIPHKRLAVVSNFGSRTLQIYFWHEFVRQILIYLGIDRLLCATQIGKLIWILLAIVLTFVLGLKVFDFPTGLIVRASRYSPEYMEKENKASGV